MELNELRDKIHQNAVNKGFYDGVQNINELPEGLKSAYIAQRIALIHSELSEALEADRIRHCANLDCFNANVRHNGLPFVNNFEANIKDSFEDEIADAIIRIFDLCGWLNIDIDTYIKLKMDYNEYREQKHGKRY